MWLSQYLWIILYVLAVVSGAPVELNKVNDDPPPHVQLKSDSEKCMKDILDLFWVSDYPFATSNLKEDRC